MRRVTLTASLLLALGSLALAAPAQAQTLPSKNEAAEWARKAEEASRLEGPGATPFHLVAKIHYALGDQNLDGTYEMLWAAPDRYRLEIRLGSIGETQVVLSDKKYVQRTTPTISLAAWSVESLFDSNIIPAPLGAFTFQVGKVFFPKNAARSQICIAEGGHASIPRQYCFDAVTTEVVSQQTLATANQTVSPQSAYSVELSDYKTVGEKRFPQNILRHNGPEQINATVEKWESVQAFGDSVFSPPPAAAAWDWCIAPEIREPKSKPPLGPLIAPESISLVNDTVKIRYLVLYKIVAADGHTKQVTRIFGATDGPAQTFIDGQLRFPSPVRLCNGKAIEYETVFEFWPLNVSRR